MWSCDLSLTRAVALHLAAAQFVQVLVKAAVMLYILSGRISDVSTAVYTFFVRDMVPNADAAFFTPPNTSRNWYYTEPVDRVLRAHEASLRTLYEGASRLDGVTVDGGLSNKLVS